MVSDNTERSIVMIQLNGGNDCLNTVIPYNSGLYYDYRPNVSIPQEDVLPIDANFGFHPSMGPMRQLWDEGKVAVINGIGYPNPNRSHFRSMDVWHTAEAVEIGKDGWLGRAIRELDPQGENVLTGINFGRGLPRALACEGVSVASVGNLETYGLLPDIEDRRLREYALKAFSQMYGIGEGRDPVSQFFGQIGTGALKGADILRQAVKKYSSSIEYADNPISQSLKNVAQTLCAGLGTRIFYTQHGSFDTHAGELEAHSKLWTDVSMAIRDFSDDLSEHGLEKNVMIMVFSEFGRRIEDNGTGTDHGSGGVAFAIGELIDGGFFGDYPSLKGEYQLEGDLHYNNDFRGTYATVLEQWLGLEAAPIVNGHFEQLRFIQN